MLHQKGNIGFVIWGVRNGFEVMLASNLTEAEFLKSDVVSDNMRQVCNTTSESFYSIHRNQKFGVVTIYHCDAKDMVGRKAYVAISLYIPSTHQFVGDVYAVLNHLKSFYIQKQGDSYVNMFTSDMFAEQYSSLSCEQSNGFVIPGIKKGYYKFNTPNDVKDRFCLMDINGYQAAFLIPSSVNGPETQLSGYQVINEFKNTFTIVIEDFDSSKHKILYKDQQINTQEKRFSLEVKPGDELIFIDQISNRRQSFSRCKPDQVISLVSLFPKIVPDFGGDTLQGETYPPNKPKEPSKWKNAFAWGMVFLILISLVVVVLDQMELIEIPEMNVEQSIVEEPSADNKDSITEKSAIAEQLQKMNKVDVTYTVLEIYKTINVLSAENKSIIKPTLEGKEGIDKIDFLDNSKKIRIVYDSSKIDIKKELTSIKLIIKPTPSPAKTEQPKNNLKKQEKKVETKNGGFRKR